MKNYKRRLFIVCAVAVMLFAAACSISMVRADEGGEPSDEMTLPSVAVSERTISIIPPHNYVNAGYNLEFALFFMDGNVRITVVDWQTGTIFEDNNYRMYLVGMRFADDITRYITVPVTVRRPTSAPASPLIAGITATSITVTVPEGHRYLLEWRLLYPIGAVVHSWQNNPVFSGLTPNTDYRVQARLIETPTHSASPPSERTDEIGQPTLIRTVGGGNLETLPPESGCGDCGMFSAIGFLIMIGAGLFGIVFAEFKRR